MNFDLGNQAPIQRYMKTKFCPICKGKNVETDLDEVHFALECNHQDLMKKDQSAG